MQKLKIGFIWQGFDGRYGKWRDGLFMAMKLIEKEHEVKYFDFPLKEIHEFKPDVVLYWEAPCTLRGENAANYQSVIDLPYKKALLFAGGPVDRAICYGFDLYFVESRLNEEEFTVLGLPWKRAFGVNTQIFKPMNLEKKYDGFMQATFAGWKRHELFADSLGDKGAVAGRLQESDRNGYNRCVERGVTIFDEQSAEEVARLINQSHCVLNTAEYWGGGQRCTLEAMACGVPVIVMSDSPKNREYVDGSGAGMVTAPDIEPIRLAIEFIKEDPVRYSERGIEYVQEKYTERHYADALLEGINQII